MQAIASLRGHDVLSGLSRGRNRAVSEVHPPSGGELRDQSLPKAASYTYFPRVKDLDEPAVLGLTGTISEDELKNGVKADGVSSGSSDGSGADSDEPPPMEQKPQLKHSNSRRSSRFLPFSSKTREPSKEPEPGRSRSKSIKRDESSTSISPVRSLSKLRRKSWVSSHSGPPSPTKETAGAQKDHARAESSRRSLTLDASKRRTSTSGPSIPKEPQGRESFEQPSQPKNRVLTKNKRLSGLFNSTNVDDQPAAADPPSVPQIPASLTSFSTDKLPSYVQTPSSPAQIPPLPRNTSAEKLKNIKTEPRKKDELWTVFRTLEADLRKFQSKSTSLKTNVVRNCLLPFLRAYASHPSNHRLRPEDLDRRANILNGWWTGLLELLAGRNNQSISGTDRPTILEGIAGVMERHEWRMAPSPLAALADRIETASTMTAKSAASNASSSSDFLAESVYHNVRNVFTQNLLSQMSFVIDKMSLRNAAASLVTFCGKTCAYAFCFCPGVADILVRLWNLSPDTMKRVLGESGISRMDKLDAVSDRIAAAFPPMLQPLRFDSLIKTVRQLRRPATIPLGTSHVDWYGGWIKRWSGAESDLFYVFVKHFHILVTEFLPKEPTDAERVCVPGLVMVQAQLLVNLDATVNRHASPQQPEEPSGGAAPITFDDVLSDPDAQASALLIPPANATRQMAENRIVMLIRDFLSERNSNIASARRMFAISFGRLLKATARRVSVYDNNACYTLCDFLEEAFVILSRYEQFDNSRHLTLDWPFWLSVFRHMAQSENTATEIKLFAFLYSTWPTLVADEMRKQSLCLDFLLEPKFFESRFNHWCPMVRAYFMRLLCWRVARVDDDESENEIKIMRALSDRLQSVWSHYQWLRDQAEINRVLPPSTQACNPAPGRRFLIIRNDNPIVTNTQPFLSFDGVVQTPASGKPPGSSSPPQRPLSALSTDSLDFPDEAPSKSPWSKLRSFMTGTPKQTPKSRNSEPPRKENTKSANTDASKGRPETPSNSKSGTNSTPSPPAPTHRSYSFRFSLEWVDKRFGVYQNMRLSPPRLPLPAQVLLQTKGINLKPVLSCQPPQHAATSSKYAGRSLAEWTFVSHECQNFFDRRKNEGVPTNKLVENPTLAVEAFRRPG